MLNCSALCNGQADGVDRPSTVGVTARPGVQRGQFDEGLCMDAGEGFHLPLTRRLHEADLRFERDVRRNLDPTVCGMN